MYHNGLPRRKGIALTAALAVAAIAWAAPAGAAATPLKCKTAITSATAKYEQAKLKELGKCEALKRKGKLPVSTICLTEPTKTGPKIAAALEKMQKSIDKACCGGNDDDCATLANPAIALSAIDWDARSNTCVLGGRNGLPCATTSQCPNMCTGGTREGLGCQNDSVCVFACSTLCTGGANNLEPCLSGADCPGGICDIGAGNRCQIGATNAGAACTVVPNSCVIPAGTCQLTSGCVGTGDFCPNFESSPGCSNALADAGDVLDCVTCVENVAAEQLNAGDYAFLNGKTCFGGTNDDAVCTIKDDCPDGKCGEKDTEKCKSTLAKEAEKFAVAKNKARQKCEKARVKDPLDPPSCPDADTQEKIDKAANKFRDKVIKACAGDDEAFGGSDDFIPSQIGAPLSCPSLCPNLLTPATDDAATTCGQIGYITTVRELYDCLACLGECKADCTTALSAPSNFAGGSVPGFCNPGCGDGDITKLCVNGTRDDLPCTVDANCPGGLCSFTESCDDGNNNDGDSCPSGCIINTCSVNATDRTVTVAFTPPAGKDLGSLTIYLKYPEHLARIPGSGAAIQVFNAINVIPGNTTLLPNDLDYAVRMQISENGNATIPAGNLLTITMDQCNLQPAPAPGDFTCIVEDAAKAGATLGLPINGATCTVVSVS